jgi:hypothetical protein
MAKWVIGPCVVFVLALTATGCGGDDDASAKAPSKAEFIKQVDGICEAGNRRMEATFSKLLEGEKELPLPSDPRVEKLVGQVMIPNLEREIEEMNELEPPDGDEEKVEAFINALEEGLETAEENPKLVTTKTEVVYGISSRLAKEYGFEICGTR